MGQARKYTPPLRNKPYNPPLGFSIHYPKEGESPSPLVTIHDTGTPLFSSPALDSISQTIGSFGDFLGNISKGEFWLNVGALVAGIIILALSINGLIKSESMKRSNGIERSLRYGYRPKRRK